MGLTDKYQERLDSEDGPLTWIDKHTAVYYRPAEVKVIRKAAKYMGCSAVPILCQPAVGYRILSHMEAGYTLEEACEIFGRENRKGEWHG